MQQQRPHLESVAAILGIAIVMMLIALDQTVVGTALPRVVAELQGFGLYPWVAASYLMTTSILLPITGRLGDLYGRKPFLLAAILLFTFASALCGMAQSMIQLVLARGLQGVGGGMLAGVAFASVSDLFPDALERVRWQVVLSASYGIASALGPVLGGWMTEHLGWRSVFYVNLPIGILAVAVVAKYLPRVSHNEGGETTIDWLGAVLLAMAVCTLLITTERGGDIGFTRPLFWGLVGLSALLVWLFMRHQHRSNAPIIPPHLFANPAVRRLTLLGALTGLILFVLLFYAPLLLQGGFDLSPKDAGVLISPLLVSITVGSITNGRLMPRLRRPERLFSWGVLLLIAGIALLCTVSRATPHLFVGLIFTVCGFSLGFQLPNLTLQIQAAVAKQDTGIASALIQTARTLGSMFGASIAGLVVSLSFGHRAGEALAGAKITSPQVSRLFGSPQLLLREQDQAVLRQLGRSLNFEPSGLLEQARLGLVSGVRYAFIGCVMLALISFFISRQLPPFTSRRKEWNPE
ncbi:MAG TPA: MFS transporter [Rhodocyclaceae bacterium]|nr:MFS transporter [Rhodocyclaceae bacterium]